MNTEEMMADASSTKRNQPKEGPLTKAVEKQTAKIPSIAYLAMAGGAIAVSLDLVRCSPRKKRTSANSSPY